MQITGITNSLFYIVCAIAFVHVAEECSYQSLRWRSLRLGLGTRKVDVNFRCSTCRI